jgi:hypothetical protein
MFLLLKESKTKLLSIKFSQNVVVLLAFIVFPRKFQLRNWMPWKL